MGKKIFSTLIIIILFIIFDFIYFKVNLYFGNRHQFSIIYFLLSSVLIFLILENQIYNILFNLKSAKFKIILFITFPLVISMLISDRLNAINKFYFFSKTFHLRENTLWEFDNLLGWKNTPNSFGSLGYNLHDSIKGSIPVIIDSIGYRTVPDSLKLISDTLDLYLGCSFTFGSRIEAQNSFAYKTSKLLNHNYLNAGASGYGLGQMKQLFESLIKKYRFKYVFIQLSPWLADRAMELNFPLYYVTRACPYFSDEGRYFKLNPPAFSTLGNTNRNWRDTKLSYYDRMQFFISAGITMEICDYYFYKLARLKIYIGLHPKPTNRKTELEKYCYDFMIDICKKNNTIPIILKIGYQGFGYKGGTQNLNDLLDYLNTKAKIIDLDIYLKQKVSETGKRFEQLFYINVIYRNYIIIIDHHPNEYANKLFSEKIYKELELK
jgi:hypothetical protein